MKITIEPELTTSLDYFFAFPYKIFKGQTKPTEYIKIPLQQRDYEWGNTDSSEGANNIESLLEDLDYHIENNDDIYFSGTVLLENQNDKFLRLIDGQQRITTLYLLNVLAYLIARYRLEYMPTYPDPYAYTFQFSQRFESYIKFEKRIFISDLENSPEHLISRDNNKDSNAKLIKRIGRSNSAEIDYWSRIIFRLQFEDKEINALFSDTIKKASLTVQNDKISFNRQGGNYSKGLNIILDYYQSIDDRGALSNDDYLKNIIMKIEDQLKACGMASIISEDENDSFRLFEILNDRGMDLSALDLIKNIILEKCKKEEIEIPDFSSEWKNLKANVNKSFTKGKADSSFIENIIRSEGSNVKNREISYLSNKLNTNTINERNAIFVNESIKDFFKRLLKSSEILKFMNENTKNNLANNTSPYSRFPKSTLQYVTFMKMINFNWGPQIILSSNIQYVKSTNYENSLISDWQNNSSNPQQVDLNHFNRFLSDISLKLGILGIVNGLTTKGLPTASKDIAKLIIENVEKNPNDFNSHLKLNQLKQSIINHLKNKIFDNSNKGLFEARLSNTFVASTPQKKNIVKILLYIIYNQGGVTHNIQFPELEHLEPTSPLQGSNPYYSGIDRPEIINRLGNFALIEKVTNIDFSNKPLIEKIRLATTDPDLTSKAIFQNDIFKNLNFLNPVPNSTIYGKMPLIKIARDNNPETDDSFEINGTPLPYFFNERSKFLARLAKNLICDTTKFLDGDSSY